MALIVGGTTVTGSTSLTSSTLSGALPEIDGSALTNLPGLSSDQVGSGYAQVSYDAVGSVGLFKMGDQFSGRSKGQTIAGSQLNPTSAGHTAQGNTVSGTWSCMGAASNSNNNTNTTVFRRQS